MERDERYWKGADHEEWESRVLALRSEIADLDEAISAAGGLAADHVQVRVGDLIQMKGHVGTVKRVNPKGYTIVIAGRTPEWPLTLDRSWFQKVIATKEELEAQQQQQAEAQA